MADATAISITGIVVSGIAGPALSAYWSDKRSARERRSALAERDLHELRDIFADCLKLMIDARPKLIAVEILAEDGALDPTDALSDQEPGAELREAREEISELRKINTAMHQEYPRLVLMLDTKHPAVNAFLEAASHLTDTLSIPSDLMNGTVNRDDAIAQLVDGRKNLTADMARFISACEPVARRTPS